MIPHSCCNTAHIPAVFPSVRWSPRVVWISHCLPCDISPRWIHSLARVSNSLGILSLFLHTSHKYVPWILAVFFLSVLFLFSLITHFFLSQGKVCIVAQKNVNWETLRSLVALHLTKQLQFNFLKFSSWHWNRIFWLTVLEELMMLRILQERTTDVHDVPKFSKLSALKLLLYSALGIARKFR